MPQLRRIGLRAEHAMFAATQGVNTHRGAIFGLGLLCAAAGAVGRFGDVHAPSLGQLIRVRWGQAILNGPRLSDSHGEVVKRRFGAGGARHEAAAGFTSIYRIGLPALELGMELSRGDSEAARVQACFALIATVVDTNLLHRGGDDGLRLAQRRAQEFLDSGGVGQPEWRRAAAVVHQAFKERRLSPGGVADLLAMTLFVKAVEHAPVRCVVI